MKVVVTEKYSGDYADLFSAFYDEYAPLFRENNIDEITDLATYYQALDLVLKTDGQKQPRNLFMRLPLEEPVFSIDLDSRLITVPSEFATNGLGVQGDANAEMVFFKCANHYDTVDLYSIVQANHCYIQWTNTSTHKSGNSLAVLHDTMEQEMIFGWMITENMTAGAGTLEFSIRWFDLNDDGDIIYSISTQKASCPIKSTLNLDVESTEQNKLAYDDVRDIIYTRPRFSGIINSMTGASPVILVTLDGNATMDLSTDAETYPQYNEDMAEQYPNGILPLTVGATSPDNKKIYYQWYNGDNLISAKDGNKVVYNDSEEVGATASTYHKSTYIATTAGTYYAKVGNGETNGTNIRWLTTPSVVIPAANDISFVDGADGQDWGLVPAYRFSKKTADPEHGIPESVAYAGDVLSVKVKGQNVRDGQVKSQLVYTWKKAALDSDNFVTVEGKTASTYTPDNNEEGKFKCEIVNKYNNTQSATLVTEVPVTVRARPDKPTTIEIRFDNTTKSVYCDSVSFPPNSLSATHSNEWQYQWSNNLAGGQLVGQTDDRYYVSALPENDGSSSAYQISLAVRHVVNGFAGPWSYSPAINLHVGRDDNGNKTYTLL